MTTLKQYIAECTGTFILVFIGVGAVIANVVSQGGVGIVGIALAFGFAVMASVYMFAGISGAHINPAITVALIVNRNISFAKGLGYITSQLVGASLAALGLWIVFGSRDLLGSGVTILRPGVSLTQGFLTEAGLTFFLMMAVFAFIRNDAAKERWLHGAVVIGFVVAMDILLGGILTGASMNPARTFGPALLSGVWINHLVYWVGPIVGGLAAVVINKIWNKV